MSDVPAKFDANQLADKLRDRIRATLGELIPEEQWDVLMRAEVKRFFEPTLESYTSRAAPSGFQAVAEQILTNEVRERLAKYLKESPEWAARWSEDGGVASLPKRLEEMIERNLPVLMRECVVQLIAGISQKSTMDSVMTIEAKMRGY